MIFKYMFAVVASCAMFYFLVWRRHSSLPRVFVVGFFGVGILFILVPELSNQLAHFVGIGRGADLILYVSTLFLVFVCFNFYIRFRELEEKFTAIVRRIALEHPDVSDREELDPAQKQKGD